MKRNEEERRGEERRGEEGRGESSYERPKNPCGPP